VALAEVLVAPAGVVVVEDEEDLESSEVELPQPAMATASAAERMVAATVARRVEPARPGWRPPHASHRHRVRGAEIAAPAT
jgi:hypothetical protein